MIEKISREECSRHIFLNLKGPIEHRAQVSFKADEITLKPKLETISLTIHSSISLNTMKMSPARIRKLKELLEAVLEEIE